MDKKYQSCDTLGSWYVAMILLELLLIHYFYVKVDIGE